MKLKAFTLRLIFSRTNQQLFPLYVILVQDKHGAGRPAGFAFRVSTAREQRIDPMGAETISDGG